MSTDGKRLESLVRQIEELLLPTCFSVKGSNRVFNDEGVQIAEFDIEIHGKLGSTEISWLIECRDRPSDGPAPGSWIEQLVGRRDRFGFNKVTAVSTTGFAAGAAEYARNSGIELRTVNEIQAADVAKWLGLCQITFDTRVSRLDGASILVSENEPRERVEALERILKDAKGDQKLLRSTETNEMITPALAFQIVVSSHEGLFDGLLPNGPGKSVTIRASYPNDQSHFVIDTDVGSIRVTQLLFKGELLLKQTEIPFDSIKEYRRDGTNEPIAQTVTFPMEIHGSPFALEMHNLADTGETHILLRKVSS